MHPKTDHWFVFLKVELNQLNRQAMKFDLRAKRIKFRNLL